MAPTTLLTLHEELQAYIYELVLVQQLPIRPDISRLANDQQRIAPTLSLLATCKSIRCIAKSAYYGKNTFILEGGNEDIKTEVVEGEIARYNCDSKICADNSIHPLSKH